MAFGKMRAAIVVLGAAGLLAAAACGEPLPPAPVDQGGGGIPGGGGGSGGTGTGGAGGGSGGAGGTHSGDGCDDPADDCNGGICRFATVDCELAADNWQAQCNSTPAPPTADHCGLADPVEGSCRSREEIVALCNAAFRLRPSENATWHCFEQHAACDASYMNCVIVESCGN